MSNLSTWALFLRAVNPRRYQAACPRPCRSDAVLIVMRAIAQTYSERLDANREDFLQSSAAYSTYGEDTHLRMMKGLIARSDKQPREEALCVGRSPGGCATAVLTDQGGTGGEVKPSRLTQQDLPSSGRQWFACCTLMCFLCLAFPFPLFVPLTTPLTVFPCGSEKNILCFNSSRIDLRYNKLRPTVALTSFPRVVLQDIG